MDDGTPKEGMEALFPFPHTLPYASLAFEISYNKLANMLP
jgi:hypothetical protein